MPSARIGMQERAKAGWGEDPAIWPCGVHPEGVGSYCRDRASGISRDYPVPRGGLAAASSSHHHHHPLPGECP